MNDRVLVVAEAASDARIVLALAERELRASSADWVRDHLDEHGWDGLFALETHAPDPCLDWVGLKGLVQAARLPRRMRFDRQDDPHVARVVDACRELGCDRAVVHRDADVCAPAFATRLRGLAAPQVAVARPEPCTEAWGLAAAGLPGATSTPEAKQRAGDAGLRDEQAVQVVLSAPDGPWTRASDLAAFVADVSRVLGVGRAVP